MKALISPFEQVRGFYRIAAVSEQGFDVAQPLFWIDCEATTLPDRHYFDPIDEQIKLLPDDGSSAGPDDVVLTYNP